MGAYSLWGKPMGYTRSRNLITTNPILKIVTYTHTPRGRGTLIHELFC